MSETTPATATPPVAQAPGLTPVSAPLSQGRTSIETAPCYCCGSRMGVPAPAYWGFFLPGMLDHVQCVQCPATYNARTGQSNDPVIVALHAAYALLLVAIVVGMWVATRG